jgi:hypothetical protein
MATGAITEWDDGLGRGLITEDGNGVHVVSRWDCSPSLQDILRGRTIPPGSVGVTFDLGIGNNAINVADSVSGDNPTEPYG